jgi:hypothetical protein
MSQERHGANAITVGGTELLLTSTSGGSAVHLTRAAEPGSAGRGAVHDFYFDASNQRSAALKRSYDQAALLAPCWASTTLCGREWAVMIAGEGGPFDDWSDEVAFAPSCRRCLSVMDKLFPAPKPDERLALVAQLVADAVQEHGHAEIRDVPGDQQDAVRKAVRTLVRQRTGESCHSYAHENLVLFASEAIDAEHAQENMHAAAEAIDRALTGADTTPAHEPAWRVWWETWAVG